MHHVTLIDLREQLRRFALRHTRNADAAEDVAQDVIARLLQTLHDGDAPEQPLGWVLRAARNRIVDDARSRSRHAVTVPDNVWSALASPPDATDDAAGSELTGCMHRMVAQLPDEYREPLRRADLLEEDRETIAAGLGLTMSALKTRIMRGRRMLHGLLLACCHFDFSTTDGRLDGITPRADGCSPGGCNPPLTSNGDCP
ncbi:MAG: sigma-70 family RNA polymerase sigma factor [Planctomycetota bacterium]